MMSKTLTLPRIHDLIVVGDQAARADIPGAHIVEHPSRIDLLHRPFRVWDGEQEHRAHRIVLANGGGPSPALFRDWLAHTRDGILLSEDGRTNVAGVFAA